MATWETVLQQGGRNAMKPLTLQTLNCVLSFIIMNNPTDFNGICSQNACRIRAEFYPYPSSCQCTACSISSYLLIQLVRGIFKPGFFLPVV